MLGKGIKLSDSCALVCPCFPSRQAYTYGEHTDASMLSSRTNIIQIRVI